MKGEHMLLAAKVGIGIFLMGAAMELLKGVLTGSPRDVMLAGLYVLLIVVMASMLFDYLGRKL